MLKLEERNWKLCKIFCEAEDRKRRMKNMYFLLRLVLLLGSIFFLLFFCILRINSINFNLFLYGILFSLETFLHHNKTIFHFFHNKKYPERVLLLVFGRRKKNWQNTSCYFVTNNVVNGTGWIIEFYEGKNCSFKDIGIWYLIILYKIQLNIVNLSSWYSL